MARKKNVDTPSDADVRASITGEHAAEAAEPRTDGTGKYGKPEPVIRQEIEGIEGDAGETEQVPPANLTPPWEGPEAKPAEPVPPKEDGQEKFKDRYEESVKWNTRLSQDVSDLRRSLEQMRAEATRPREPERPTITKEQLAEFRDRDPDGYYQYVANEIADKRSRQVEQRLEMISSMLGGVLAKSETDSFAREYSDFSDLRTEISQELGKLPPELTTNPAYYRQALNSAYWTVKGRKMAESEQRARDQGRREAQTRSEIKSGSYVEGGGKTTPAPQLDLKSASSREIFSYMKKRGLVPDS